jgi:hypothetical protein
MSNQARPYPSSASVVLACVVIGYTALTLAATSDTNAGGKAPAAAQGKANFYLYRDPKINVAITTKLSVNGKEISATKHTTCGHWEVNPGTYDITSESASASTVRVVAEAGKSYYIWQEVKVSPMGATNLLHVVDAETGQRGVKACTSFLETKPAATP